SPRLSGGSPPVIRKDDFRGYGTSPAQSGAKKVGAWIRPAHVQQMLKLLFIGDIVGRPGRDIIADRLPQLRIEREIDFVIANGENAAAGAGITGAIAKAILENGVDAITLGDHVWDQRGWEN